MADAVEQARRMLDEIHASTMRTARTIGARESLVAEAEAEYRTVRDALIAAVRADRDAAWREGVEAVRGTMPGINKRPDEVSNDAFYETRGMENALAALAARMEAK